MERSTGHAELDVAAMKAFYPLAIQAKHRQQSENADYLLDDRLPLLAAADTPAKRIQRRFHLCEEMPLSLAQLPTSAFQFLFSTTQSRPHPAE